MNEKKKMTPIRAIRMYCVFECSSGSTAQVRNCPSEKCYFYQYRMGKNPSRKGKGGNPNVDKLNSKENG